MTYHMHSRSADSVYQDCRHGDILHLTAPPFFPSFSVSCLPRPTLPPISCYRPVPLRPPRTPAQATPSLVCPPLQPTTVQPCPTPPHDSYSTNLSPRDSTTPVQPASFESAPTSSQRFVQTSQTHHSDMLQLHELFSPKIHRRSAHLDHINVLDPNTEFPIGIVARLIRHDHTRDQSDIIVLQTLADSLRAFMYVQERADAVGCAVPGSETPALGLIFRRAYL